MTIPLGWKKSRLGEECTIEIGGTPSRHVAAYWDDAKETANLWVSIRDMDTQTITETAEHITALGVKHSNVKLQTEGTVLLSFKLTIGRVAIAGLPLYTNEAIAGLRSKSLAHEYLYHGLQQWDLLQGVDQAIKGATLNKEKLKNISIKFPQSVEEQSNIAKILSTVDRAIEQTEVGLVKQQRIKTGLTQDLLTRGIDEHGALRSEKTHKFKDSPLGRIPEEWSVGSLLDATARNRQAILTGPFGADLGDADFVEEGVPVLRIGNVQRGRIDMSDLLFVSPAKAAQLSRYVIKTGDLLFARQGATTGRNALASEGANGCLINYHIIRVALDHDRCAPHFIEAMFDSELVKRQIDREKGRGTREGINTAQLKALQLKLPPVSEQRRIASLLQVIEARDTKTRRLREKLTRYKAALMQDLLTGRKRTTSLQDSKPNCEKMYAS